MLRQNIELADNERQFPVSGRIEDESDLAFAGLLHLRNMAVVGSMAGTVLFKGLHGEYDILDGDRFAVMMARGRAQPKGRRGEIRRMTHGLGDQTIIGGNFIERGYQQGVGDHAGAGGNRSLQPRHHLVEIIEGTERNHAHAAELRRIRIDVIKALELGRIFELAEQR